MLTSTLYSKQTVEAKYLDGLFLLRVWSMFPVGTLLSREAKREESSWTWQVLYVQTVCTRELALYLLKAWRWRQTNQIMSLAMVMAYYVVMFSDKYKLVLTSWAITKKVQEARIVVYQDTEQSLASHHFQTREYNFNKFQIV